MKAFILAAGFGKRMRPITDKTPKPLVKVTGVKLLDRTLDQLAAAGVEEAVINTHYLGKQIEAAIKGRTAPRVRLSAEKELLDTGGGIKNALRYFGDEAFYVLSGDGFYTDGDSGDALKRLAVAWDPGKMDILILLQPLETFKLTQGAGDYDLAGDGRAQRSKNKSGAYMFTSIRINAPAIFKGAPEGAFSYLDLLDAAETRGRLYGLVHDGEWHHISTPEDLKAVDAAFAGEKS